MLEKTYHETWQARFKRLGDVAYSDYLKSEEWAKIKRVAKTRDHYSRCWICGQTKGLEIHHRSYKWIGTKDAMRGLVAVCRTCHEAIHTYARERGISVRLATNHVKNSRDVGWFARLESKRRGGNLCTSDQQ